MSGRLSTNLLICASLASSHLLRGGPCDLCRFGRAVATQHPSRKHQVRRTLPHPPFEFRRCESNANTQRATCGGGLPKGDIAGSAATSVWRHADRSGLNPIVHLATDRTTPGRSIYRYFAVEQFPVPAFPSVSGRAFASLLVAHWSWVRPD